MPDADDDDFMRWASVILDPGTPQDSEIYERAIAETLGLKAADRHHRFVERMRRIDWFTDHVLMPTALVFVTVWLTLVCIYLLSR